MVAFLFEEFWAEGLPWISLILRKLHSLTTDKFELQKHCHYSVVALYEFSYNLFATVVSECRLRKLW